MSTDTALLHFIGIMSWELDQGINVSGLFLDIKKELWFDKFLHCWSCYYLGGQCLTVGSAGVELWGLTVVLNWLKYYLTFSQQGVRISGVFGDKGQIKCVVLRGSV